MKNWIVYLLLSTPVVYGLYAAYYYNNTLSFIKDNGIATDGDIQWVLYTRGYTHDLFDNPGIGEWIAAPIRGCSFETIIKGEAPVEEVITVYTNKYIYFLEGNVITTELGHEYTYNTRQEAIDALEQFSADAVNEPINMEILVTSYYCESGEVMDEDAIVDVLVEPWILDKIALTYTHIGNREPIDVVDERYPAVRPLLWDYYHD